MELNWFVVVSFKCHREEGCSSGTPKSHEDLESLKEQQSRERFEFEEEQLKLKSLQEAEELNQKCLQEELQRLQEEALKQKRLQEEEELKLRRHREEEELKLIRLREEQERKHQRQLTETRIRAEINETQAVIDAHEHQTLSADNQITVSNFLTERSQHVNIGDEVPGPSKTSESVLCRPSIDNVISTLAFRVDTKIASSALPKCNPRENVMLKPNVTKGNEPVQNGTPSYMPSQFIRHPAAPFQSFTNPADATHEPTVAQNQWVTNSQPVDYFSAIRPAMNTIPRTQPTPDRELLLGSVNRELGSAVSQPSDGFKEFMHASPNNLSNFHQSPQNVLVLPSATPVLEPEVFDGNPANYRNFVDAFDALITFNVPERRRRLFYLLRYTKRPAYSLVKGCQYMDAKLRYTKARELLQPFGQKFQVAKACIDTLTNGPVLHQNDKASLLRFSSELNSCMNTLKGMNYLDKMNNLDVITRIAKRFPHPWINGWQTEVDSLIHIKRCDVIIENLASYVALKTRQMTNLDCDWTTSKKFVANKNR